MDIQKLKEELSDRIGIPSSILSGKTIEETLKQAREIVAYKEKADAEAQKTKTPREKFVEFLNRNTDDEEMPKETASNILFNIEERLRVESGGYPIIRDSGEIDPSKMPSPYSTREQFAEFFGHGNI